LHWIAKVADQDEFGDRESFEPVVSESEGEHGDASEKAAAEMEPAREESFIIGLVNQRLESALSDSDDYAEGQRQAMLAMSSELPEIVSNNLRMASDAELIAELKSRGFRVSKVKTKA
jgi:hypothetical protein